MRICVFCASSEAVTERHRVVARALGTALAGRGWSLVYGGGGIGLMGEVARSATAGGADVLGVIPERLTTRELAFPEITELVVVPTMRERKARMDREADAFVVLPGGIGTLEEFVEILTLKQLGYHDRPVVLLDPDGFWAPLVALLEHMTAEGLAGAQLLGSFVTTGSPEEALDAADAAPADAGRVGAPSGAAPGATEVVEIIEDAPGEAVPGGARRPAPTAPAGEEGSTTWQRR